MFCFLEVMELPEQENQQHGPRHGERGLATTESMTPVVTNAKRCPDISTHASPGRSDGHPKFVNSQPVEATWTDEPRKSSHARTDVRRAPRLRSENDTCRDCSTRENDRRPRTRDPPEPCSVLRDPSPQADIRSVWARKRSVTLRHIRPRRRRKAPGGQTERTGPRRSRARQRPATVPIVRLVSPEGPLRLATMPHSWSDFRS